MIVARAFAAQLLVACILATGAASAQTYPNRPVTLVVPFPPGGATDAIARIMQDSMSQSLGQQVVIENIGGAGGTIAAARAARAAPDGYTIMIHQVALAAGMTLYPKLTFDAKKDFVPIGQGPPILGGFGAILLVAGVRCSFRDRGSREPR